MSLNRIFKLSFLCLVLSVLSMAQTKVKSDSPSNTPAYSLPQDELAKIDRVFQSYFNGISKFDYQAMRQACSSDYLLFEDGLVWTVEDHINFLKPLEGKAKITYSFNDVKKSIDGPVAWRTHRNVADAMMDGNPVHFEWIESIVFHRYNGEWKMVLLHSTTAKAEKK